ncbi:MAG: hypothetical protein HY000_20980 [Planctomycetes bacterium]|nr:hypothetical protein [Planctomycetota bacterium]
MGWQGPGFAVDLVSEFGELHLDQRSQRVALDPEFPCQLADESLPRGAAVGVDAVAMFSLAARRDDEALWLPAGWRYLQLEGVSFGQRNLGCRNRWQRHTLALMRFPALRRPGVRDGLQELFPPTGTAQHIAHVLAVALLELGRQHSDPHRLGHSAQNPCGELAPFLTGPVPVRDEHDFDAREEPRELRGQTTCVQTTRQQAKAIKCRRVFRAFHEVPDVTRLGQSNLAFDVREEEASRLALGEKSLGPLH